MRHLVISTEAGPIYLVGRIHADPKRPVLFAMTGFWSPDTQLHDLVDHFQGVSVLVAPMPGMGDSVSLPAFDVRDFSRAIELTLATVVPGRRVVLLGSSAGCLATLGVRSTQVARHVAVEPFFRTAALWPLHDIARRFLAAEPHAVGAHRAAEVILGHGPAGAVAERDYRWLLDGLEAPLDVVVGALGLEPQRELPIAPSFTSAADRELLASRPNTRLTQAHEESGHNLMETPQGARLVRDVAHAALRAAF
jgi:hypothetical protein